MYVRSMQQNLKEFSFRQPVTPAIEFNSRIPQLPYDPSCPSVGRSVVWLTCLPQFRPHPQKGKYWEVTLPQLNARVTAHSVTSGVNLLILDTPAEILQPGLRGSDQGPARHGRVHQVGLGHTHQVLGPNVLHPADKVIDLS